MAHSAADTKDPFHVLIVGAGAAGLLIAQGLQKNGIRYTLFERDSASDYNSRPRDWTMGLHWGRALLAPLLPDHLARQLWRIEADPYALGGHADTGLFPDAEPPPNIDGYEFVLTEKQETDFSVVDLATGDVVSSVGAVTSRRAGRRRLREFLRQGLNIEYGKKLASIIDEPDKHVSLHFDDGSTARGHIVVGADGVRSAVRSHILPPSQNQLHFLPIRLYNFNASYSASDALAIRRAATHPLFWYGIDDANAAVFTMSVIDVPDPCDASTWRFQLGFDVWDGPRSLPSPSTSSAGNSVNDTTSNNSADTLSFTTPDPTALHPHLESDAARLAHLKSLAHRFPPPFNRAVAALPDGGVRISPDRISHLPVLHAWSGALADKGKVALAGDAAHPMAPYRGQGLNNAVADAMGFVNVAVSCAGAFAGEEGEMVRARLVSAYGQEVRARGQKEIEVSGRQAFAVHRLEEFKRSAVAARGFHR